jgi:transcriptional regulator with XRE-family HTH domain
MDSKSREPITETEYFLKNTSYLFKLTRVGRRWSLSEASGRIKLSEQSMCEFENRKVKLGCIDTVFKMQQGYDYDFYDVFMPYTTVPSLADINAVDAKAAELGRHLHCKNLPMPGSREEKKLNEEWAAWAKPFLDRFYERVRK